MAFFSALELARAAGLPVITRSKPCPHCRSKTFIVEPGKGPHRVHLRCAECGRSGGWLKKEDEK
jgi:transposase-like protein